LRRECKVEEAAFLWLRWSRERRQREKKVKKTFFSSFAEKPKTHFVASPHGAVVECARIELKFCQLARYHDEMIGEVLKSFSSVLYIQFKDQDTRYQSKNI
jgi:hypothetical protein